MSPSVIPIIVKLQLQLKVLVIPVFSFFQISNVQDWVEDGENSVQTYGQIIGECLNCNIMVKTEDGKLSMDLELKSMNGYEAMAFAQSLLAWMCSRTK